MELTAHALFVSTPKQGKTRFLIEVTYRLTQEDGVWVATCPEIGASSFGDSLDEAQAALNEAVGLLLAEADEEGYLPAYLRDRQLQPRVIPDSTDTDRRWLALEPALSL